MTQTLLTFGIDEGPARRALTAALTSAGFRVTNSPRMVPSIQVLIRDGSGDEAEVRRIVGLHVPTAEVMPPGAPLVGIENYRAGRP